MKAALLLGAEKSVALALLGVKVEDWFTLGYLRLAINIVTKPMMVITRAHIGAQATHSPSLILDSRTRAPTRIKIKPKI
jgi:hypothetical protein|tara:strand:+ start:456 stop:692 length:237 start_codon:yes stop_codon:yes gene_type:complete